jgi:GNAT superfamily N-acetyltransferase
VIMLPDVRIDLLADHLDLVELITRWHWAEWGHAYPESSAEEWMSNIASRAGRGPVPFTLVVWVGEEPVGAVSLAEHDMPPDPAFARLTPCVSGTYILPSWRRKGIGAVLMEALEARAASFELGTLFLFTGEAEAFYRRVGWRTIAESEDHGSPVAVMEKCIVKESQGTAGDRNS